jgi:hypothetical protein
MPTSNIFSIPLLIYLGITLLIIGFVSVFFMQRLNEQNHKLVSMLTLVSTMAEEINAMRFHFTSANVGGSGGRSSSFDQNQNTTPFSLRNSADKIAVSDDEYEEDDSDEDDDSDDDSDSDNDNDNNDKNNGNNEEINLVESVNDASTIKIINVFGLEELDLHAIDDNEESDNDDLDDQMSSSEDEEPNETKIKMEIGINNVVSLLEENINVNKIVEDPEPFEPKVEVVLDEPCVVVPADFLKTIHIGEEKLEDKNIDHENYRKMNIQKLRQIVQEKELSIDTQKLKKPELLKLLGVSSPEKAE